MEQSFVLADVDATLVLIRKKHKNGKEASNAGMSHHWTMLYKMPTRIWVQHPIRNSCTQNIVLFGGQKSEDAVLLLHLIII